MLWLCRLRVDCDSRGAWITDRASGLVQVIAICLVAFVAYSVRMSTLRRVLALLTFKLRVDFQMDALNASLLQ